MALTVDIVSAERRLFHGEATEVYARSVEGEFGVQPGHIPFLALLASSPIRLTTTDGDEVIAAVHRGFLEVSDDELTILSDIAELVDDIDVARAEAAKERALEHLVLPDYPGDARGELDRAETRLRAAAYVAVARSSE